MRARPPTRERVAGRCRFASAVPALFYGDARQTSSARASRRTSATVFLTPRQRREGRYQRHRGLLLRESLNKPRADATEAMWDAVLGASPKQYREYYKGLRQRNAPTAPRPDGLAQNARQLRRASRIHHVLGLTRSTWDLFRGSFSAGQFLAYSVLLFSGPALPGETELRA